MLTVNFRIPMTEVLLDMGGLTEFATRLVEPAQFIVDLHTNRDENATS